MHSIDWGARQIIYCWLERVSKWNGFALASNNHDRTLSLPLIRWSAASCHNYTKMRSSPLGTATDHSVIYWLAPTMVDHSAQCSLSLTIAQLIISFALLSNFHYIRHYCPILFLFLLHLPFWFAPANYELLFFQINQSPIDRTSTLSTIIVVLKCLDRVGAYTVQILSTLCLVVFPSQL